MLKTRRALTAGRTETRLAPHCQLLPRWRARIALEGAMKVLREKWPRQWCSLWTGDPTGDVTMLVQ